MAEGGETAEAACQGGGAQGRGRKPQHAALEAEKGAETDCLPVRLGGVWPCLQPDLRLLASRTQRTQIVVLNSNCVNVCVTSKFLLKYYSRSDSISQRGPLRSD